MKPFSEIMEEFNKCDFWGLSTCIDVFNADPKKMKDEDVIESYINDICRKIDMIKYGDSVIAEFGIDERVNGFSFMQLIETSSITGHFANLTNRIYIDIFSCKIYNPYEAGEFTKNYFDGESVHVHYRYRK